MNILNSFRYLHLLTGLVAVVAGLLFSIPFFTLTNPLNLTGLTCLLLGLINLQQFNQPTRAFSPAKGAVYIIASITLLVATTVQVVTLLALPAFGVFTAHTVGLAIASVCLMTVLVLVDQLSGKVSHPARSTAHTDDIDYDDNEEREAGTVKWFNTSKGFGFISRDQGEDVFVHFRAIRGDGHRVLEEGQRVEFVVARREKGLQAEDVSILD
ncbi:hypothetical protein LCGC14_0032360 [marine sediment metagenome]